MNRKDNRRPALRKEKVSIIAASVFVLSALTLAGVYMSEQGDVENEENRIDFAKLEDGAVDEDIAAEEGRVDTRYVSGKAEADLASGDKNKGDSRYVNSDEYDLSQNNDMDVDPAFTEVQSGQVENTRQAGTDKAAVFMNEQEQTAAAAAPLSFSDKDKLALPVVGDVLLDYSMDKAVYHATMKQYRYSPALVVAADEGQTITAAADAVVLDVFFDAETGNSIRFDLGNGYELTYGQLEDIRLKAGDRVSAGDVVGKIARPTIYYTEEGSNIYYKLTKDGVPVDPLKRK